MECPRRGLGGVCAVGGLCRGGKGAELAASSVEKISALDLSIG